jgi:hypothetical protein
MPRQRRLLPRRRSPRPLPRQRHQPTLRAVGPAPATEPPPRPAMVRRRAAQRPATGLRRAIRMGRRRPLRATVPPPAVRMGRRPLDMPRRRQAEQATLAVRARARDLPAGLPVMARRGIPRRREAMRLTLRMAAVSGPAPMARAAMCTTRSGTWTFIMA